MDFVRFDFGENRAVFKGSNRKTVVKVSRDFVVEGESRRRYNRETSEGFELVRFFFLSFFF